MTRSSHRVHAHILDFDDDLERTLRRKRKQPELSPPSSSSEPESEAETDLEEEQDMAVDNRSIKELSASELDNAVPLCIQYPRAAAGKTDEFELKSSLLHHIPRYHGLSMEDPNKHLKEFEVVCSSMTPINVDGNILKMKAFPFSLMDKAKDWLYELAPGTVTSWESMKKAFLEKFFPTSRIIVLRKKISGIQQGPGESFPVYYERFKTLVASCPQHQMKEELLIQYFYEGLLPLERQMLDASAGGALVDKTPVAAKILIANRALNAQQYEGVGGRDHAQPSQVNEVSAISELQSQMANLSTLISQVVEGPKVQSTATCSVCSMHGHHTDQCPQLIANGGWESANAIGYQGQTQPRYDPFSNTYNPGWRDHPNFKWREPQQTQQQGGYRQPPPGFYQRPFAPPQPQPQTAQSNSDVLVRVNHLIFPADFYVLEMEDSAHSTPLPILLGRPFMKTARTNIDVFKGTLTMEFDGDIIDFNISEAMRYPMDDHSCFSVDAFDSLAQEKLESLDRDALETPIVQGIELIKNGAEPNHEEICEMVAALESLPQYVGKPPIPIPIPISTNKLLPSMIQAPTLELKPLRNHLKKRKAIRKRWKWKTSLYAYLGENRTLPVIVAANLSLVEQEKLLRVLREHKTALGWTFADIKGISPSKCMHRILLEDNAKPNERCSETA
ncbi:unnamed protein product [Prunus brigantina]